MKKELIGDGQVQTPVPLLRHNRLTKLKDLFEPTPIEIHKAIIKKISTYAKNPRRIKMKLKPVVSHDCGRSLSFKELAATERRLLSEGKNINPKYSNMEVKKMNKEVEARTERLFKVVKLYIEARQCFRTTMLKGENAKSNRRDIADDEKYFERNIRDDLNRLRKKGLIYSRGRPPAWYLGSDEQFQEDKLKGMTPVTGTVQIPERVTVDININVTFS